MIGIKKNKKEQTRKFFHTFFDTHVSCIFCRKKSSFYYDEKVRKIMMINSPMKNVNYYEIYELTKSLYPYNILNSFVYDYYLYFKKSNTVISNGFYNNFSNFDSRHIEYKDAKISALFKNTIKDNIYSRILPDSIIRIGANEKKVITYIKSLSINGILLQPSSQNNPLAIIFINTDTIRNLMNSLNLEHGGWAYISDPEGQLVFKLSNTQEGIEIVNVKGENGFFSKSQNGSSMNICYTVSKNNGWKYVAAISEKIVFSKLSHIKNIVITLALILIIIELILAYLLAYSNSKPIKDLLKTALSLWSTENKAVCNDDYGTIKITMTELSANNRKLSNILEEQSIVLKTTLLERLLRGEFINKDFVLNSLSLAKLRFDGRRFLVLIIKIDRYEHNADLEALEELRIQKDLIVRSVFTYLDNRIYDLNFFDHGEDRIVVLLNIKDEECDIKLDLDTSFERLHDYFDEQYKCSLIFFVGGVYENLMDIWHSYNEANEALDLWTCEAIDIKFWRQDINKNLNLFYYPINIENRILNAIRNRNQNEIEIMLKIVFEENFVKRKLSEKMIDKLIDDINSTVLKAYEALNSSDSVLEAQIFNFCFKKDYKNNPKKYFQILGEIYCIIHRATSCNKETYQSGLMERIIGYIDNNITNPDLNLVLVGQQFRLSTPYLSQIFKAYTDINFSEYVENHRMEKACKLLEDNAIPINEIAKKTGYSSDIVFRRVFKRNKSISPSAYREML